MLKIVQVANHFFQTSCLFEAWIDGCCEMKQDQVGFSKGTIFVWLARSSKVNHNFEILDLISMKGTDHDDAGSPEQAHSKVLDFQPLSRKYRPPKECKILVC